MMRMAIHDSKTMNVMKYSASSARVDEDIVNTKKDGFQNNMSSSSSDKSEAIENVLILQGGGSLGDFGCGVFKALSQKEVRSISLQGHQLVV